MKKFAVFVFVIFLSAPGVFAGESLINDPGRPYQLYLTAETGAVLITDHRIQFGVDGTFFDYVKEGGQNILFPFNRYTAELRLFEKHSVVFLYQPLEVITEAVAEQDLSFYGETFAKGTPMRFKYGFSFFRASYLYYFIKEEKSELGAGVSLQLRNASIAFTSSDGAQQVITQNLGPVPIIKLAGKHRFESGEWAGIEADGFYASSAYLSGAEYPFEGAIWDISGRAGISLKNGISPFINLRYLGGGSKGTSQSKDATGDGFANNWLSTFSLTLGVVLE